MLVSPKLVEFHAPFKGIQQTQALTVSNDTTAPMAFKVKTTAPKLYCVRPNSGVLQPGESAEVTIIFQGLLEEPPLGSKCKDKFLFVSIPCTSTIISKDVSTNWSELEKLAGGKSTDIKLKVSFNYDNAMNTIQEERSNISTHSIGGANTSSAQITNNSYQPIQPIQPIEEQIQDVEPVVSNIPDNSIQASSSGINSNITNNPTSRTSASVNPSTNINEITNEKEISSSEKKSDVHVAPPTTTVKSSSNETNIYLIGLVVLILFFLLSRLF